MKNYNKTKWEMWLMLAISFLVAIFLRLSTSVISDNLSNELNFTPMQISNISTLTLYSYAFLQIPLGIIIDKYGTKKVSSVGMIIAGSGSILFGIMSNINLAYLSRIMIGAGTSGIMLAIMKLQVNWFDKDEFIKLTARMSIFASLGAIGSTFPLSMFNSLVGWRNSFLLIGIIGVLLGILIFLRLKDTPKEYGYDVVLVKEEYEEISVFTGLKSVLKNKSTWYNSFIMMSLVGITTAFSSLWIVPYITDVYQVDKHTSAFIAAFLTYGMLAGSIVSDKVYSKFKTKKLNVVRLCGITNMLIWTYILILNNAKPPIYTLPILFFMVGCLNMSHIEAFNDVKRKNEQRYSGLSTSIINCSEFIGSGILNIFIAFTIEHSSSVVNGYKFGFMLFIVMNIITIVSATIGVSDDKNYIEKEKQAIL